ncbi:MAG: exosome complex RNA-binding protein Rrp4 [Euryarchaeota archaeon]|nr:exosome complex RNA-binding protein Rrp4 [Euryarchaeota archaeon]
MDHNIVIPGQMLSEDVKSAGHGTYVKDDKVYSLYYGVANLKDRTYVVPFSGKYIPSRKDYLIGVVIQLTSSNWIFDIRSPYDGLLHVSEYPKRVDSSEMKRIMDIGDCAILRVKDVSKSMRTDVTMRERGLRPLKNGRLIEILSTKVPRVIGHNGSMVSMLKKESNCDMFVGQNGRIWIHGKDSDMDRLTEAIDLIEREAHMSGLTEKVQQFLSNDPVVEDEIVSGSDESDDPESDISSEDNNDIIHEETRRKVDALLDEAEDA